jgi:hypothetical protein
MSTKTDDVTFISHHVDVPISARIPVRIMSDATTQRPSLPGPQQVLERLREW